MAQEGIVSEVEALSSQLVSAFDGAWNARDAEALASLFHEDGDFHFYNGLELRGRRLIQRIYGRSVFPSLPEGLVHKTRSMSVRLLSDAVALGDGKVDLLDTTKSDEEKQVQLTISATIILTHDDGCWGISAVRLMVPVDA
jgi:uncharacterized protein (TIGR02246 family)